ncbi:MAG TPA: radical SAM protein [Alphaproteobacteria bacterium]
MGKRVLVVNAFFDEYRRTAGSPHRVPRAMGHVFLAGAFERSTTEVRLYNEQYSGPLHDAALLGSPDLLVLTGVTSSFDRMLHLAAYARTLNPRVIVAAGGPAIRALPRRAARFFDYPCTGDIEALQEVARDALGPAHVAEEMFPRFDLADPHRLVAYVESSRNCNFRCGFCSLTGEGGRYRHYEIDYLKRQIEAVGKKQIVLIDNNFYGNDRRFFLDRVALLRDFYRSGRIDGWSALVTGDFFARRENLDLVREAGCQSLFSGVESLDAETLRAHNKRHSTVVPQLEMIRTCLEAGVLFSYGIMLDPSVRRLEKLRAEIGLLLDTPTITLPAYFTLSIPLLGTPYFYDCLAQHRLLPHVRLRDLDGVTLALRSLDRLEEAVGFARDLPSLRGYRTRVLRHAVRFLRHYRRRLTPLQLFAAMVTSALISNETFASSPLRLRLRRPRRTYLASTEELDPLYRPFMRLPARFEAYFRPTMVSDAHGALHDDVADDVDPDARSERRHFGIPSVACGPSDNRRPTS